MKTTYLKILLLLGLVCSLIAVLTSCSADDNAHGFTPTNPNLSLSQKNYEVSKEKGELTLEVDANLPWRIEANSNWVAADLLQGTAGKHKLTISYDKNAALEERVATLTIWINDQSKEQITIRQAQATIDDTYNHYYVKEGALADGSSWESPTSLGKALQLATNNNDVIHIAEGVYAPESHEWVTSANDKDQTFLIQANIKLIGGYPKDASADSKPQLGLKTVLTGKGQNTHVLVVLAQKISGLAVSLENLTITQGKADAEASHLSIKGFNVPRDHGGGVVIMESTVILNNCEIVKNQSGRHAAGIFVTQNSSVEILHSKINENTGVNSNSNAGGIFVSNSAVNLSFSEVSYNTVGGVAGGIQTLNSSEINLTNVTVTHNESRSNAGGFYHRGNSKSVIVNSYFYNNQSTEGGAIATHDGTVMHLIGTTIYHNESKKLYGAINNQANNSIYVYNSLIFDNIGTAANNGINPIGQISLTKSAVHNQIFGDENTAVASFTAQDLNASNPIKLRPSSATNAVATRGMSSEELAALRNTLGGSSTIEVFTSDLDGKSRVGKQTIGAYIY